jgi:hypothetical protein
MQMKLAYKGLHTSFMNGQRNGNRRKLNRLEKALRMLNMDFTFAKYKELCETIVESIYSTLTFNQYFHSKNNISEKFILLRHDIDRKPENALKMAELENSLGVNSTYYFRKKEDVFIPAIIKKMADMGHEIGYHYETLDKAGGDFEKAIRIFEDELKEFRNICDVKTICMHGNPLSKWVNKDLWKKYDFKDFGIIGEPYLSIDYTKVLYLTDTGRSWNSKFSVKDVVGANSRRNEKIKSTDDVIKMSNEGQVDQMCLLTHPERWSDNFGAWVKELAWQNVKNVGKEILVRRAYYGKK